MGAAAGWPGPGSRRSSRIGFTRSIGTDHIDIFIVAVGADMLKQERTDSEQTALGIDEGRTTPVGMGR